MKKIYALLFTITFGSLSFGQNLVANGDFEMTNVKDWTICLSQGCSKTVQ